MLLAVVGLFLLTELPQGVLTLCSIFVANFFRDVYWPLGDLLDIAALLNNAINFVLYCTMSRQFRETFVETFLGQSCSRCGRSPGRGGSTQLTQLTGRGTPRATGGGSTETGKMGPAAGWLKLETVTAADASSPLITSTKLPTGSSADGQQDDDGTLNQSSPVSVRE